MSKDNLGLDVGQAVELKLALRRSGWSNQNIKTLCEGSLLEPIKTYVRAEAFVLTDTNVPPRLEGVSNDELMLDVSQAEELKLAFRKTGWKNEDIKALCEGDRLAYARTVLLGEAQVMTSVCSIGDDTLPKWPDLFGHIHPYPEEEFSFHHKMGDVQLQKRNGILYANDRQVTRINLPFIEDVGPSFNQLPETVAEREFLNANCFLTLMENKELLPDEWHEGNTYSLGTITLAGGVLRIEDHYGSFKGGVSNLLNAFQTYHNFAHAAVLV